MLTTTTGPDAPARAALPRLFDAAEDTINLAGGLPDPQLFPSTELGEAIRSLLRVGGRTLLQYSTYRVPDILVDAIAAAMDLRGARVESQNLIPSAGSQNALLTVALAHAGPGAVVLCETPLYPGAAAAFRTAGVRPVAVVSDADGPVPDSVTLTARSVRAAGGTPVLLYVNPTFQNPTGRLMPASRRHLLIDAAARADLVVVEDDPYALLSFPGVRVDATTAPTLRELDPSRVVHLGTFSKILAPGLRCGWIEAPSHLCAELRTVAEIATLSPSPLAQAAIGRFHARHGWDDLVSRFRVAYARRAELMEHALRSGLDSERWSWDSPRGGFYVWLRRANGEPTADVVARAAALGVSVVGGEHFSLDDEHSNGIRLSFSHVGDDHVAEAVSRLCAAAADSHTSPAVAS